MNVSLGICHAHNLKSLAPYPSHRCFQQVSKLKLCMVSQVFYLYLTVHSLALSLVCISVIIVSNIIIRYICYGWAVNWNLIAWLKSILLIYDMHQVLCCSCKFLKLCKGLKCGSHLRYLWDQHDSQWQS